MQIFGLIGLLVTFAVGIWWFFGNGPQSEISKQEEVSLYQDALDQAREVAGAATEQVEVYSGYSYARDITKLDLSNKGLTGSLKAEIRQLSKLKELNLSHNEFTGVPAEVGQLSNLGVLNLSFNPITGLPHELGNLQNLKTLDLRGTNYSAFDLQEIKKGLPPTTNIITY